MVPSTESCILSEDEEMRNQTCPLCSHTDPMATEDFVWKKPFAQSVYTAQFSGQNCECERVMGVVLRSAVQNAECVYNGE